MSASTQHELPTRRAGTSSADVLNRRASGAGSSAVRDLLTHAARPGMLSLAGGLPDASLFPVDELAELTERLLRTDGARILQYGRTEGEGAVRETLANHFGFADPDRTLITTGSQQGLDLLLRVVAEPGDEIVVADPEYVGFLQVLAANSCRPVPIPTDADGLDVEALARRLADGLRPKACYVVPHFHNPTGVSLAPARWAQLVELSNRYGFVLIEDDPYRDLYYTPDARPTALTGVGDGADDGVEGELLVRLRTTSKTLVPGLRLALIDAPPPIHDAMVIAKQSCDLHTSTLSQAIVSAAVGAAWLPAHLDRLRESYRSKCATLIEALEATFGDRVSVNRPAGGMFVWAAFGPTGGAGRNAAGSEPVDTAIWLERAVDRGVCFVPGQAFAVSADLRHCARFSFATVAGERIDEAVERLAASASVTDRLVAANSDNLSLAD